MAIDLNRGSNGIVLPPAVSSEIWAETINASAVMAVSRRTDLPGAGKTYPMITGDVEAEWVAETDEKPVGTPTVSSKSMTPYTIAVIVPFSNQFRRDLPGLYGEMVRRIPGALGKKFDQTVFAATGAPGSNFDQLGGAEALEISSPAEYAELAAVVTSLAEDGREASHILAGPALHGALLTSTDSLGRPFFVADPSNSRTVGSVFGTPVVKTPAAAYGMAGDFANHAIYGVVEGVSVDISDQASLTIGAEVINLWQRNMFAVRAEIEVGFIYRDLNAFRRLVPATVTP